MATEITVGRMDKGDMEFHVVKVGEKHPYAPIPPAGGTALGLSTGYLTFTMFLTPPLHEEIADLAGTCIGCGLYVAQGGLVVPTFIFQAKPPAAWHIQAPLIATSDEVDCWLKTDSNRVIFYLMEAGTGIVRQIRFIGLGQNFLRQMKSIVQKASPLAADISLYGQCMSAIGEQGIWERGAKWAWNLKRKEFRRMK